MDAAAGERRYGKTGRGSRSVDRSGAVSQPASALEILLAEWRGGLRLGSDRRSCAVHHEGVTNRRVSRAYSALAVLYAVAQARSYLEPVGDLVVGDWNVFRAGRRDHRDLDVLALEALSLFRRAVEHSVSRPEALAHGV